MTAHTKPRHRSTQGWGVCSFQNFDEPEPGAFDAADLLPDDIRTLRRAERMPQAAYTELASPNMRRDAYAAIALRASKRKERRTTALLWTTLALCVLAFTGVTLWTLTH